MQNNEVGVSSASDNFVTQYFPRIEQLYYREPSDTLHKKYHSLQSVCPYTSRFNVTYHFIGCIDFCDVQLDVLQPWHFGLQLVSPGMGSGRAAERARSNILQLIRRLSFHSRVLDLPRGRTVPLNAMGMTRVS